MASRRLVKVLAPRHISHCQDSPLGLWPPSPHQKSAQGTMGVVCATRANGQEDASSSSVLPRRWSCCSSIFDQERGLCKQAQPLYAISLSRKKRHYCSHPTVHCYITVPRCLGKGTGLEAGCAFPSMGIVSPPHPSSGFSRNGPTRNFPNGFVTPPFLRPYRKPAWRLPPASFLSLPPEHSLEPSQRPVSWQRRALLSLVLTTLSFLPSDTEASINYGKQQSWGHQVPEAPGCSH